MKANWREVRGIVAQSGFGWNVEDDCVEAESAVWEAYIEVRVHCAAMSFGVAVCSRSNGVSGL